MGTMQETMPETAETMQLEWEEFQRKKARITEAIGYLQERIHKRNEDAESATLLQGIKDLTNFVKDALSKIGIHAKNIENRAALMQEKQKEEIKSSLLLRVRKLNRWFDSSDGKKSVYYINPWMSKAIIDDFDLPPLSLPALQYLEAENERDGYRIAALKKDIKEARRAIALSKGRLGEMRRSLRHKIAQQESELDAINKGAMSWATSNRCRLQWVLGKNLLPAADVISLYKRAYPDEDISDLLPMVPHSEQHIQYPPKPRKKRSENISSVAVSNNGTANLPPWKFFIVQHKTDKGKELPLERAKFLVAVQPELDEVRGLDGGILHTKLCKITAMNLHQRQSNSMMTRIIDSEWREWCRFPIAGYRIVFHVDEKSREVKFIPCKKGEEPYKTT